MNPMDWHDQNQLEGERLSRTLEALDEIYGCGMYETAEFFARELGVRNFWSPEKTHATQR